MIKKFLCIFILIFLTTTSLYAEESGIETITRTKEGELTACSFVIKLSVFDEEAYAPGVRNFLAYLISHKITDKKNESGERETEALGAFVFTDISPDYITISFICRNRDLTKLLELTADGITHPIDKNYKTLRSNFVKEYKPIDGMIDNIYTLFLTQYYRYHPYKRINQYSPIAISRTDADKMEALSSKIISSDRVVLSISGSFEQNRVKEIVRHYFGTIPNSPKKPTEIQWEPEASEKQLFLYTLGGNAWLVIGYATPSFGGIDYPTSLVATELLGGGFSSYFWNEIREKQGLSYQIGALNPALEGPAHTMFYITAQPKNIMKIRKLAFDILQKSTQNLPSPQALETAKAKVIGRYLLSRESDLNFTKESAGLKAISPKYLSQEELLKEIRNVSATDVREFCKKYFKEPTIIIIRPPGLYLNDTYL